MPGFTGFELYSGATITRVVDASGAEWIACCGKRKSDLQFGFYVFRNGVNVPLSPFCSARGSINDDGHWIAWEGSQYFTGALPGFVPFPSNAELEQRIAALEIRVNAAPPVVNNGVLLIPAQLPPREGGELILEDGAGGGAWHIDVFDGRLRMHKDGQVVVEWGI